MKYFILLLILLCCSVFVKGQNQYSAEPSPVLLKERWEAEWITCPESSLYDYGVYHFRKTLTLDSQLDSFIINIDLILKNIILLWWHQKLWVINNGASSSSPPS